MGLFLTIAYIVLTIVSPTQLGPAWANYHVMVYLAVLTTLFSLPNIASGSSLLVSVQTYLLLAFIAIVGVSQIANHWLGGALQAWLTFLPSAAVYFFIVANVTTLRRLKVVTFAIVAACLGLVVEAFCGYYGSLPGHTFYLGQNVDSGGTVDRIIRLRAAGFLHDPNDFSQMLIIVIALLFVAWRTGRIATNTLLVIAPAAVFLWAIYLTHSRGALIGLAVLALIAGYKRIGKVPALTLSVILGLGLMAVNFTGGRAIDPSAGAERLELWAEGLEAFKHSPIFGIGFGNIDLSGYTAHNSFVLPLVELGIIGATVFVALLVTTMLDLNRLIAIREAPAGVPTVPATTSNADRCQEDRHSSFPFSLSSAPEAPQQPIPHTEPAFALYADSDPAALEFSPLDGPSIIEDAAPADPLDETVPFAPEWLPSSDEASDIASTPNDGPPSFDEPLTVESAPHTAVFLAGNPLPQIRAALVSFIITAWFLSRTYDTTIYLVLGLAVAAIGLEPDSAAPRDHRRWVLWTLAIVPFLIVFIYLVVRLRH